MTTAQLLEEKRSLAAVIDHTLLKPDAVAADIDRVAAEAVEYGFASVCINPVWVPRVYERLSGSNVKVCTVIGFPLGANTTETKVFEADLARKQGASELDMVLNVGALRAGDYSFAQSDIARVAEVVHAGGALVKVIIETCLLSDDQKAEACRLAMAAGADYVKTSTGFAKSGATVADIRLMRSVVGPSLGVKASGGIRDLGTVKAMLEAGASRIGASASVAIVNELDGGQAGTLAGGY